MKTGRSVQVFPPEDSQLHFRKYVAADNDLVGIALHGGGLAAIIQLTATTHLRSDARRFRNQQHLLNLHLDFLNPCERCESTIAVVPLKVGAAVSTLQLQLL